jgi:hypothetical protein
MAFAIGYDKESEEGRSLEVLHILEYLIFDLENERVNVCGDFLVRNNSDRPARLHVLHRGNIDFQIDFQKPVGRKKWLDDEVYTGVLKAVPASRGLSVNRTGLSVGYGGITLRYASCPHSEVEILPCVFLEELVERPGHGMYVPFTGFKSPELKPQKHCLFRVAGAVEGASYAHIMPEPGSDDPIELKGGKSLLEQIEAEIDRLPPGLSRRYRSAYQGFSRIHAYPEFHSFFPEFADGSLMSVSPVSTDLRTRRENVKIGRRRVSWLVADSDFNTYTRGYGPNMDVRKKPVEETPSTQQHSQSLVLI